VGDPVEAPLGAYTVRLSPTADALTLELIDADGQSIAATGEARVFLTGTGEAPQRVVLQAMDSTWTGAAKAAGAPGYVAVVSLKLGDNAESARLTWGTVPGTPAPEGHGSTEGSGAAHDHGAGSHSHGEGGQADGAGGHAH
jgi:hypothetical protein